MSVLTLPEFDKQKSDRNSSLKSIVFDENYLKCKDHIQRLANFLVRADELCQISMNNCHINDYGLEKLLFEFVKLTMIEKISLAYNQFTSVGASRVSKMIEEHNSNGFNRKGIKHINFKGNTISTKGA